MPSDLVSKCVESLKSMQKNAELVGDQEEIDANDNGKIDAEDFEILRKEKKDKEDTDNAEEKEASFSPGFWWDKVAYESPSPAEKKPSTMASALTASKKDDGSVDYGKHPNLNRMQRTYATMLAGPPSAKPRKDKKVGPIGETLLAKLKERKVAP